MSSIDKINVGGVDFKIEGDVSAPEEKIAYIETGSSATRNYTVGEYVTVNGTLYKTKSPIAIDDTFVTTGTNANIINVDNLGKDLSAKVAKMENVTGYQTVDVLGYNPTTKKLGLKVNGADAVIPFNSGTELSRYGGNRQILFACDTQRMGASTIMIDTEYFEVVSVTGDATHLTSATIKAKKSFTMVMRGGFYHGTFGFTPLMSVTSIISTLNKSFNITKGDTYVFTNYKTNTEDTASACCFGYVHE